MPLAARSPSRPSLGFRSVSLPWAGSTNELGIELLPLGLAGTALPHWEGSQLTRVGPRARSPER